jgi:hyperosmotically inducible periplasmic protein
MKVRRTVVCGALATVCAACSSNKPAEEPARYPETAQAEPMAPEGQGAVGTGEAEEMNAPREAAPTGQEAAPSEERGRTPQRSESEASTSGSTAEGRTATPAPPPPRTEPATEPAPDNTGKNKRDRGGTVTPMSQGNSQADLKMTQQIRQAVMADDSLSFSAKNVKIITANGKVTLRGVVMSDEERKTIDDEARKVAGESNVDDQIEVKR